MKVYLYNVTNSLRVHYIQYLATGVYTGLGICTTGSELNQLKGWQPHR